MIRKGKFRIYYTFIFYFILVTKLKEQKKKVKALKHKISKGLGAIKHKIPKGLGSENVIITIPLFFSRPFFPLGYENGRHMSVLHPLQETLCLPLPLACKFVTFCVKL